jgi:hypothetical protein
VGALGSTSSTSGAAVRGCQHSDRGRHTSRTQSRCKTSGNTISRVHCATVPYTRRPANRAQTARSLLAATLRSGVTRRIGPPGFRLGMRCTSGHRRSERGS